MPITGTASRPLVVQSSNRTGSTSSSSSNASVAQKLSSTIDQANKLGINTSQATSVLNQNTSNPNVAYEGSSQQKAYTAANPITPTSLTPTAPVTLPTPVVTKAPDVGAGNAGITGGTTGLTGTSNGGITVDPIVQNSLTNNQSAFDTYLSSIKNADKGQQTEAQIQAKVIADSHQKQYQQSVNDYTSQINNIVASRDAQNLALTGAGRGQTTNFIGGQQAEITKQAAIQALPLQALLANAQGNLDTANQYINTWGKILTDDANNKYNHQVATAQAVYGFANAQEKTKLDSLLTQQKEVKDKATALATAKTEAIKNALGQGAPASVVQGITAATDLNGVATATGKYNGDVLGQQLKSLQIASAKRANQPTVKAPDLQNFGTATEPIWKQYNTATKQWVDVSGIAGGGSQLDARKISESQNKLDTLLDYTNQAKTLSSSSGYGLYNRVASFAVGDSNYNRLSNVVDTLKTNLLTLNTDPSIKKFFGPQMSNRDTELMVSAGSTLNAEKQSPADMQKEIGQYQNFLKSAKGWTSLGNGAVLTVNLKDPATGKTESVPVNYGTLSQAVRDGVQVSF